MPDFPLSMLRHSPRNMRSVGKDDGLDELAASMRERVARGQPPLIQNLRGCRISPKKIEIHAGGRRLSALLRLRREKVIPASLPVPVELDRPEDAVEISMVENQMRIPPHPYDQVAGFRKLAEQGLDPDRIAQRFGAWASWVRQRLALAGLHPDLLDLLKRDALPVACAQALTLTADQDRQLDCWRQLSPWQRDAWQIRRLLRDARTPVGAALFPIADYVAAGGVIERDLFDERDQGTIGSPALFAAMQRAEVDRRIAALKAEGWAEVIECDPGLGWHHHARDLNLEEMACAGERGLTEDEAAERHRLLALIRETPDPEDPAEERDARQAGIDAAERRLEALDTLAKSGVYSPEQRAAGVVLVLYAPPGSLQVREGYARRADGPAPSAGAPDGRLGDAGSGDASAPGDPAGADGAPEDPDGGRPYAAAVLQSLAAAKSHALQDLVSGDPETAVRIAVHQLIDGGYRLNPGPAGADRVGLRMVEHVFARENPVLDDGLREVLGRIGLADTAVVPAARDDAHARRHPERWRALLDAPYPLVLQAFALLVARGVGVQAGTMRSPEMFAAVAGAGRLRMADRWRPDARFLEGLTKAQLHAILTGNGLGALSERWRECRKPDLVEHMAKLFGGCPPAGCGPALQAACLDLVADWVPAGLDFDVPGPARGPVREAAE